MVVERPALNRVPALGLRLADVVQQRSPTQPDTFDTCCLRSLLCRQATPLHFGRGLGEGLLSTDHVRQHLQRVPEVILVRAPVHCFYTLQRIQFRKDDFQQSALEQQLPSARRSVRSHELLNLVDDALLRDDAYALAVAMQRLPGLRLDLEIQLRSKADAAHHAQRIVGERHVRIQRSGYQPVLHIPDAVERIHQLAEALAVQADGHRVDGEVAPLLVVLQRAVFHDGFARVVAVALLAGTHELHLLAAPMDLRGTEVAEHTHVRSTTHAPGHGLGHGYATPDDHHVDVLRWAFQEKVTHVAADDIGVDAHLVRHVTDEVEDGRIQELSEFCAV